jgi:hypothetical protein
LLILARTWFAFGLPSKTGCDSSFLLIAVFRRFTFKLSKHFVSLALHAILGGSLDGFHVKEEYDRHFRFAVASKKWVFSFSRSGNWLLIILMSTSIFCALVV